MRKLIRLTESDLHRIVRASVNRILREEDENEKWESPLDKTRNNKPKVLGKIDLPKGKSRPAKKPTMGDLKSFDQLKKLKFAENRINGVVNGVVNSVLREAEFKPPFIKDAFVNQLKDDAASGELGKAIRGFNKGKAIGTERAQYPGNDLDYETMKMEFEDAIRRMKSEGKPLSWWEVGQEVGLHLDTLNGDDIELLKDVYDEVMSEGI